MVTGLSPATRYFYRFIAGEDISVTGRTLTAPAADDLAPVRLAWFSCQNFDAGMYGAYRELIKDDDARPDDQKIQFVVHVGDFIYERIDDGGQIPLDERFEQIELRDAQGRLRKAPPFPSGGGKIDDNIFAESLDDYRHVYKSYLSDPDLREARARWPFVVTWDDHEFTNDSWQTQANYTSDNNMDEPSQERKVVANQAWFEFIPARLSGAVGVAGVTQAASDFAPVTVENAMYSEVDDDNQVTESNNRDALASMTIYRSFRYGQNVELVMTDVRSYRSDHPIPEPLTVDNPLFFTRRSVVPFDMVDIFDQGMTANGGNPPAEVDFIANPRTQSPPGTMLGPAQKTWFKETVQSSDATWKVCASGVPIMRFLVHNAEGGPLILDRVLSSDTWDGYNTERKELMTFLRDNAIDNVVVISGDIHAHFAGLVMDDFDAAAPQPAAVEFVVAGVTSNSLFSNLQNATANLGEPLLRRLVTYDATAMGGPEFVENANVLVRHGMNAANAAADTHSLADILAAKDPTVNPHLRYADTNAQGYGLLTITSDQITAQLVTINRPITDTGTDGPGVKRTATFTVDKDQIDSLAEPEITGEKPFPLDL